MDSTQTIAERYYLILIKNLNYAETKALLESVDEATRMLHSYANPIRASVSNR